MRAFVELFRELDQTTSTNAKIDAMANYFASIDHRDAAWAVHFLSGGKLKRLIQTRLLREWVGEMTGYPPWLIEETYSAVGDLAETIALLLDDPEIHIDDAPLHVWVEDRIAGLKLLEESQQREAVTSWWQALDADSRFVLNKLITGAFRVGVSKRLVTRAISKVAAVDTAEIAHRLMGDWRPTRANFASLISSESAGLAPSAPYPFFLASPLEQEPEELGTIDDWEVEWKWDGIRAQLIRREGETWLWTRGEEEVASRYPEVIAAAESLDDGTVLDGEILAWSDDKPLPFSTMQRRIGRKTVGKKLLKEAPVAFLAYDLLEFDGQDIRGAELTSRRCQLHQVVDSLPPDASIKLSSTVNRESWAEFSNLREESRQRAVEGFILKRGSSPYQVGRKRGDWWKWKVDPYTMDAVLLYAQPGHGRRSNLFTDYTFGVWKDHTLVPVAKAYSGLDNKEIEKLDRWIRRNTNERFGPVRSVKAHHVFELAFEGINKSTRHKSGIAVRFPRIARWRDDKKPADADTLTDLHRLLNAAK